MFRKTFAAFGGVVLLAAACSDSATSVAIDPAATVVSVTPANAAGGVNLGAPVVVTFNRPMMSGMEMLVVLHEGSVTGAAVAGSYAWSSDRSTLTFTPAAALRSKTSYVLHLAPDLRTSSGQRLNHQGCTSLGGRNVNQGMMGGGMMNNGAMGPGMMGKGWRALSGSYGMIFTFTTA